MKILKNVLAVLLCGLMVQNVALPPQAKAGVLTGVGLIASGADSIDQGVEIATAVTGGLLIASGVIVGTFVLVVFSAASPFFTAVGAAAIVFDAKAPNSINKVFPFLAEQQVTDLNLLGVNNVKAGKPAFTKGEVVEVLQRGDYSDEQMNAVADALTDVSAQK